MSVISSLWARLGLDARETQRGAKVARRSMLDVEGAVKRLGAVVAAGALFKLARDTVAANDQQAKLARTLGTSVELLGGLRYGAKNAGVEVNNLGVMMRALAKRTGEYARTGGGPAQKVIEQMGEGFASMVRSGAPLEQILFRIADYVRDTADEGQRLYILDQFFSETGRKAVTLFENGAKGLRGYIKEAKQLGLTLSEEDAKAAEELERAMTQLEGAVQGLVTSLTTKLTPAAKEALEFLRDDGVPILDTMVDGWEKIGKHIGFAYGQLELYIAGLRESNKLQAQSPAREARASRPNIGDTRDYLGAVAAGAQSPARGARADRQAAIERARRGQGANPAAGALGETGAGAGFIGPLLPTGAGEGFIGPTGGPGFITDTLEEADKAIGKLEEFVGKAGDAIFETAETGYKALHGLSLDTDRDWSAAAQTVAGGFTSLAGSVGAGLGQILMTSGDAAEKLGSIFQGVFNAMLGQLFSVTAEAIGLHMARMAAGVTATEGSRAGIWGVVAALAAMTALVGGVTAAVGRAQSQGRESLAKPVGLDTGADILRSGMVTVHEGERILSEADVRRAPRGGFAAGGFIQHIELRVGERVVARAMARGLPGLLRAEGAM